MRRRQGRRPAPRHVPARSTPAPRGSRCTGCGSAARDPGGRPRPRAPIQGRGQGAERRAPARPPTGREWRQPPTRSAWPRLGAAPPPATLDPLQELALLRVVFLGRDQAAIAEGSEALEGGRRVVGRGGRWARGGCDGRRLGGDCRRGRRRSAGLIDHGHPIAAGARRPSAQRARGPGRAAVDRPAARGPGARQLPSG